MYRSVPSRQGGAPLQPADVRLRLGRALRHVFRAVLPVEPARTAGPTSRADAGGARLRARAALTEARAQMPTLLDDTPPAPPAPVVDVLHSEAAGLRQALRAYTDRVDRLLAASDEERRTLREQVDRLTGELHALRAELSEVRLVLAEGKAERLGPGSEMRQGTAETAPRAAARDTQVDVAAGVGEPHAEPEAGGQGAQAHDREVATAPPPVPPPIGPDASGPSAEALARLETRVFPAGTVGILLTVQPLEDFERVAALLDRLRDDAAVEYVEPDSYQDERMQLRVTFRQPTPWPRLRAAIEAALDATIDPASVTIERGDVQVRLGAAGHPGAPLHPAS